jgi:hypothetical protein
MVNSAFRDPPTLDGQIINPDMYVPGTIAAKVAVVPVPHGAKTTEAAQSFGEFPLFEMLGYEVGFDRAWASVQGWSGDQATAYRYRGTTCLNLSVLTDDIADESALASTAKSCATHIPGASVSLAGLTVQLHSCDPGPSWRPSAQAGNDPFSGLATRAEWIDQLSVGSHMSPVVATCTAGRLITTIGIAEMAKLDNISKTTPAVAQQAFDDVSQAAVDCGFQGLSSGS